MPDIEYLTVVVTVTQKDYAIALRELAKARKSFRVLFWLGLVFLGWMFFSLLRNAEGSAAGAAVTILGVASLVVLARYAALYFAARSFVKKNPNKLGPAKHSVGPDGASYEGQHGSGQISWSAFHRIRETRDLFLLYTQSNFAQILPKRCFERPEDIEAYRQIVRNYYQGKLELLP